MQRRGGSGQPVKGQSANRPKARKAQAEPVSTDHSPEQFHRLKRERDEALEQLAATAEVLKVISSSSGELEPVFNTILENATRICEAQIAEIILAENNAVRVAAGYGDAQRLPDSEMVPLDRSTVMGRSICDQKPVHVADLQNAGDEFASGREFAKKFGHRTILCVPLIREGRALGTILVRRMEVRPFEQKHIALLTTFADQAAIAIENVRLFKAEQQRTRELSNSLEQQTATSEVLRVISSSPGDLQPVFEAILSSATSICGAEYGVLFLWLGSGQYRVAALHGVPLQLAEHRRREPVVRPAPRTGLGRVALSKQPAHTADIRAESHYLNPPVGFDPAGIALHGNARTELVVPMLKEDELIGSIIIYRTEVRPFTDKQIELVKNFAAQAVIAIENTRLLNELRESLQQQTATADVLKVISSSTGELQPVFETMLENAVRICEAKFGNLMLREGDAFRVVATHGAPPAYVDYLRSEQVFRLNPGLGQLVKTKEHYHLADIAAAPTFRDKLREATVNLAGARTLIGVPMLKDDKVIGAIIIYRQEVRPFTDKQIELVQNFAAQAVIAIENARLLNELRESLQQQTATADVLKVISGSAFELQTVFNTLVKFAMHLCEAEAATIWRPDGNVFKLSAHCGFSREFEEFCRQNPITPGGRGTVTARVAFEGKIVHVPDVLADPQFAGSEYQTRGNYRSALGIPLLRKGETIGVFVLTRADVRPYADKQIELVKTFADQAVIAIENTRLLSELREIPPAADRHRRCAQGH